MDARRTLVTGSQTIKPALRELFEDHEARIEIPYEANSLFNTVTRLETALMTVFFICIVCNATVLYKQESLESGAHFGIVIV